MSNGTSLESQYPFLSIMHPAHLRYVRQPSLNTLNSFFDCLDKLDPEKRYEIMYVSFMAMIDPGIDPGTGRVKVLERSQATYEHFKRRCVESSRFVEERLLVLALTHLALDYIFNLGDTTAVDETKDRLIGLVELVQRDPELREGVEDFNDSMRKMVDRIEDAPERAVENYQLYTYFCENVVAKLLLRE